jgi:hypothetical protein
MKLLADAREPFGWLLAGVAAIASLMLGLAIPMAILVGLSVLAVKLTAGIALTQFANGPDVALGPVEIGWMQRADRAVAAFRQLARSSRSEPIGQRCMVIGEQARATLQLLRRVAGQSSTVGRMLQGIDGTRLKEEESRLSKERAGAESDAARHEIEISLSLVAEQLGARRRLEQGRAALVARLQSGVLALEGLVPRLAEVVALGQTAGGMDGAGDRVAELADELEGLRAGLSELDQVNAIPKLKER